MPQKELEDQIQYKVVVYTSDLRGAGTDANVTLKLQAPSGQWSEALPLSNSANNFERNRMDEFVVAIKRPAPAGGADPAAPEVPRIDIGHDGKWPLAAWHLNKVMVQNLATQATMFFHANRWLDNKHGKRCTLDAGRPEDAEHQYQVRASQLDRKLARRSRARVLCDEYNTRD